MAERSTGGDVHVATLTQLVEKRCSDLLTEPSATYLCPITHELFKDPVLAHDGQTYESAAIRNHFQRSTLSPMTNLALPSKLVLPNLFCKAAVDQYKTSVVQGILDVFPAVFLLQDFTMAEKLLQWGKQCVTNQIESRQLRTQRVLLLTAMVQAACDSSSRMKLIEELLEIGGADAAQNAIT
eukprot:CAMPEP_0197927994 /NCGR_PEP_ID=MMETSP1439-20131203/101609_1 /TAXON_ID=66791 /ORGANISM="Gonyaulax spinifera, Strain CCMP409" /LENGTH=181 /DNA_ID=CAMNT_0043550585 /DNA_START=52 /DNA_END=593 /DNA_ORIENTATION=+